MTVELRVPPLGESVTEGVIARWLRRDGDLVQADEPVLELETDKAAVEIPAGATGRLEIVEREGAAVRVGAVVARIAPAPAAASAGAGAPGAAAARPPTAAPPGAGGDRAGRPAAEAPAAATAALAPPPAGAPAPAPAAARADAEPLAPAVRRLVEEHGLDPSAIEGTGRRGRLTKEDVLRHLDEAQPAERSAGTPPAASEPAGAPAAAAPPGATPAPAAVPADRGSPAAAPAGPDRAAATPPASADVGAPARAVPAPPPGEEAIERAPMSALRRRIAERLVQAQRTAAILTTFNEVDCRALLDVRRRYRERFKAVHGVDLGLMSLFARAVVLALGDVPVVNARIDGADVVYHRHVHLGIAVSTARGLVVPVVRHAHAMTLADLERAIGALAGVARDGRLTPDQLAGGTFTITNGGVFGSLLSTPLLNPPQSGILGMHRIQERPVAVDGQVAVHPMMYVALSYDHRLVDGEQAVTFLVRVKERLEDPVRMLLQV